MTAGSREKALPASPDLRSAGSAGRGGAHARSSTHTERSSESSLCVRNARHADAGAGRALALCPPPGSRAPNATPRKDLGCFQANGSHVPRYLEISLRGQAQRPHRRALSYRFRPAQRGSRPPGQRGLEYVTSGAPARKEAEVALPVCGYRGRAVSGTRLEGGLGKGECPRAAATATVPVSAGELEHLS